jgi:hypothetical protein
VSTSVLKIKDVPIVCNDILRTVPCHYDIVYWKLLLHSKITASGITTLRIFTLPICFVIQLNISHLKNQDSMSLRNESRSPGGTLFPIELIITSHYYYYYYYYYYYLFTAICKNSPTARCVTAANCVCKATDIFTKPVTSLKQTLR